MVRMAYISVIIPTYNRADVLGRAIDSVLAQTWTDFELIVIDDGSTDATATVLTQRKDPRLRRLYQENKGVSAARNHGIATSSGSYIALLDSDDYWLPTKLEQHIAFMRESGFTISQTEEIWIRNGVRVNACARHGKLAGWFLEDSLRLCLISPSCVMFSRHVWNELGPFDERLPACEDYSLWLRIGLRYAVGLLPQALTIKTGGHADQLSRSIIGLDLYRIYAMLDALGTMHMRSEQKMMLVTALRDKVRVYARGCIKHGKDEEAVRVWELAAPFLRSESAD